MARPAVLRRLAVAVCATALLASTSGRADIQGGLNDGYSDNFDYPNVTTTQSAPLDQT